MFDNKVFVSASYRTGSALVEVRPDFTHRVVWTTRDVGLHFNTAIYRDGHLYAFDGRNEPDASLVCVDAASGKVVWRETPEWTETFEVRGARQQQTLSTYRGSLLAADGQFLCLGEIGHLLWLNLSPKRLQRSVARLAVPRARVVGGPGPQPRPPLRGAEHARPVARKRPATALLRSQGVARPPRERRTPNAEQRTENEERRMGDRMRFARRRRRVRSGCQLHAIASLALRFIKCKVGAVQDILDSRVGDLRFAHPDAA